MTGSGTIEGHDRARAAWWRPNVGASAEFTDRLAAPAAFVITGVSIGLLAADQGGYFSGSWRLATPFYAAVVVAILAGARDLRVPRAALVTVAGLTALCAWTAASWLWSDDRTATVHDAHLVLVYVAGGAALVLLANGGRGVAVAGGVVAAATAVDCFSMVSRLYPRTFGMYNTGGGYGRLYQPIGYWNGLGALSVIGIILGLGFAARGGMLTRMLAAAALIPLSTTLYLTFSRGALVGLAAGLVALVALDKSRVQLIVAAAAGSIGAAGALLAVHAHGALTKYNRELGEQTVQGAQTAARMISLVPLGMGAAALVSGLEARFTVSRFARTLAGAGMVLAACAAVAVGVNRFGNPVGLVHDAIHTFEKPAPTFPKGDLNLRLLSLSPNGRVVFWKTAWHDFTAHPAVGSGGGTFARYWAVHRPVKSASETPTACTWRRWPSSGWSGSQSCSWRCSSRSGRAFTAAPTRSRRRRWRPTSPSWCTPAGTGHGSSPASPWRRSRARRPASASWRIPAACGSQSRPGWPGSRWRSRSPRVGAWGG